MTSESNGNGGSSAIRAVPTIVRPLQAPAIDARRRQVSEALHVGNPGNRARELPDSLDASLAGPSELPVEQIRPYEHNPRRTRNARFEDIKASIQASGIHTPLTVTRRPGEAHFIVEAGGNTRLVAIQQLWSETRDLRFSRVAVRYRPWRSERHVLTAHLVENEQRGEMTFWDKARGIVALKAQLEAEQGRTLSLRQLEEALRGAGLAVNTATLAHYVFATERLAILGEGIPALSGLDVKTLQPRLNALIRYAAEDADLSEDTLYAEVFEPAFREAVARYTRVGRFSIATLIEACEGALAERYQTSVDTLRGARRAHGPLFRAGEVPVTSAVLQPRLASSESPVEGVSTADRRCASNAAGSRVTPAGELEAGASGTLLDLVLAFAALARVERYVTPCTAAPRGYYANAIGPNDAPTAAQRRAWCVLAGLAGQEEAGTSTVTLDAAFCEWLTDTRDDAANALWRVLSHARIFSGTLDSPAALGDAVASEAG